MDRDYEIFEILADGSPIWRGHAPGLPDARLLLERIAAKTKNECIAMHLLTRQIAARINVGGASGRGSKPLVFQVAYGDNALATERGELLKLHGYEVVSVIGNEAAKLVLDLEETWDFFVVGYDAPKEVREEMVAWIKGRFPEVKVLAVNDPAVPELPGADYNVIQGIPDPALAVLNKEFGDNPTRPKAASA